MVTGRELEVSHAGDPLWHLLCQGCGMRMLAGSTAWLMAEHPQPGGWMGSARSPASQQTNQVESTASPGISAPTGVVFISNSRGAMLRVYREMGERAAYLCSL